MTVTPVDMTRADSTYTTGPLPRIISTPNPAILNLSDQEVAQVKSLSETVVSSRWALEERNAYYEGTNVLRDLGISLPPQMRGLRVALGWCRTAVDALNSRLNLEGFRFPESTDVDQGMQDIFLGNNLDAEAPMAHLDALIFKASFGVVGTNPDNPDVPIVSIESPLDMAASWDARTRKPTAALRLYGSKQATLYLPNENVSLEDTEAGWVVVDRDRHNLGEVLVERITNRARAHDRGGASEITPELMRVTDSACRTLQALEVAREFYAAPQRYILGADESAFMGPDGQLKSAWETYTGRVLALERDAEGNVPTVGQFTPYDPATYTKVIDMYARVVSSMTSLPPHVLGFTTENPASADAIRNSENSLVLKANHKTRTFGVDWSSLMRKALAVRDGDFNPQAHRIAAVWAATATPTPGATTDAVTKQIQAGYLPATSDVTGEKLGYSPLERARIEQDRTAESGSAALTSIAATVAQRLNQPQAVDGGTGTA